MEVGGGGAGSYAFSSLIGDRDSNYTAGAVARGGRLLPNLVLMFE